MYSDKSSIFNTNSNIVSTLIWVFLFGSFITVSSFPMILALFLILKFERRSELVRNHAGQALITAFVAFFISAAINIITGMFVILLSWIPVVNITAYALKLLIDNAFMLIMLAYSILGFLKALQDKPISLPLIGELGKRLSYSIKP